jgi:hypothetical protein
MITITELLQPVTTAQQNEKFLSALEAVGLKARSWREGGSLRTILKIVAAAYAGFTKSMLGFVQAGFLETATFGWLTLLAFYVYGVTRIDQTFATGQVQLTNGGGGVYSGGSAIPVGGLVVQHATTGKTYTNTAIIDGFNPGVTLFASISATEAGSPSSAQVGTITVLQTVLPGVTCTNLVAIVGADAEADPDLRTRCKNKLSTISGLGPRGAYAYAVKSALRTDGSVVNVNRLSISPSSSTGVVTIYVASPTGAPLSTDLPFITTSIEKYARPDSVTVVLLPANPVSLARTLTVWAKRSDGVAAADIRLLVANALAAVTSTYPIGGITKPPSLQGYLYATTVEGTAEAAHPSIYAIDGAGADLAMSPGDVVTLAATINVNLVDVS